MMVWVDLVLWLPVLTVIKMTWHRLDERPLGYIIALIIYLVPARRLARLPGKDPPMKTEAFLNGWHAHRVSVASSDDNPYDDTRQSYSFNQWVEGWCARHDAVKHDLPLEHDERVG
jgi:hypothetical protein